MSHTHKIKLRHLQIDSAHFSGDIAIFSSGGVTKTAWIEIIDDGGAMVHKDIITIRTPDKDLTEIARAALVKELDRLELEGNQ